METLYIKNEDQFYLSGDVVLYEKLPADLYSLAMNYDTGKFYFAKEDVNTDDLIALPNSVSDQISGIVGKFLTSQIKESFERYGILYKRGILMYGPPGTGKTCIIDQLIEKAKAKDIVVLLNPNPSWVKAAATKIRGIEKSDRTIMVIWEDFEHILDHQEAEILELLDGIEQIDNVIYIATTNYIEKIPQRIRNRPSRFADVIEVGYPTAEVRSIFLHSKVQKEDSVNVDEWIERTEGLTIDHLKDLIISVLVLGNSFEESIEKLRNMGTEELKEIKRKMSGLQKRLLDKCDEPEAETCSPCTAGRG